MDKNPEIFLGHIIAAIEAIERYTCDINKNDFKFNDEKQNAVIRQFEIIGEAAKNIPAKFRKSYSNIPWSDIRGMRNKLIHEYFGVDLNSVWKTTKDDLPVLKNQIAEILKSMDDNRKKLF